MDRGPVSRRIDSSGAQDDGKRHELPAPKIVTALAQLAEAHRYAADIGRNVCDFAVEIGSLGLERNDLRWLLLYGYLQHAQEVPRGKNGQTGMSTFCAMHPRGCCGKNQPGSSPSRCFRQVNGPSLTARSCFLLTETGLELAHRFKGAGPSADAATLPAAATDCPHTVTLGPHWDPARRELWLGDILVKRLRQPSRYQEPILLEFQREGWPPSIDDPLPYDTEQDPKNRLRQAIHRLNLHQKNNRICFEANGTGERVCWKPLP